LLVEPIPLASFYFLSSPILPPGLTPNVKFLGTAEQSLLTSSRRSARNDETTNEGLINMTARRTPANRKATAPVKLSGELVEVPSEALANEAAAAEAIAQDAPADEVADAIADLEAEANGTRKVPAKKPAKATPVKKAPAPTSHAACTHAKAGAEGKKARAACRREKAAEAAKAAKA